MRYLVLGGSGLVGYELANSLTRKGEVAYTYLKNRIAIPQASAHQLDIKDPEAIASLMQELKPEVIFHMAAPPSVDWHEANMEAAYQINVLGTRHIAQKANDLGARLVYLSTSFVFPGFGRMFSEDDIPAPISFYGITKLGAEQATRLNQGHLIFRTDQIYGWDRPGQKKSFVVNVLEKLRKGEKTEVCRDWYNCPTYVKDLVDAMVRLANDGKTGTYHGVGSSFINRYDWAVKIAEKFDMDQSLVIGIDSETLNLPAKRPNVQITNSKVQAAAGMSMKTVEQGLDAMKEERQ